MDILDKWKWIPTSLHVYCRSCAFGKEDNPTASDSLWIESPAELYSNRRSTQHRQKTATTTAEATADGLINIQLWFDVKQIKAQLTFSTELSSATTTTIFKCTVVDSVVGRREALHMMSREEKSLWRKIRIVVVVGKTEEQE